MTAQIFPVDFEFDFANNKTHNLIVVPVKEGKKLIGRRLLGIGSFSYDQAALLVDTGLIPAAAYAGFMTLDSVIEKLAAGNRSMPLADFL